MENGHKVDFEDLKDEFLMSKIKEMTVSLKHRELPDMNEVFGDELKLDASISDEAR